MKPNPICITKQKFKFENEGERDLEKKGTNVKSHLRTYAAYFSSAWCCSLCLCLSFLPSLYVFAVCVCTCSLFVSMLSFFFSFACTPSIYREIPKKLFPYFSLNWSDHGVVFVSFSSTAPNFMLSHDPFFSFFSLLFFSFLFKLPLFSLTPPLFRPTFTKPCSLLSGDATSLFTFQLLFLFLFYLICVYLLLLY